MNIAQMSDIRGPVAMVTGGRRAWGWRWHEVLAHSSKYARSHCWTNPFYGIPTFLHQSS